MAGLSRPTATVASAEAAEKLWSSRRQRRDAEVPERLVRLNKRVREASRILGELQARFPEIFDGRPWVRS